jgi:serine/threonine protein kinase
VHRDLKPENLLLDKAGDNPRITIIDFGTSGVFEVGKKMS